MVKTKFDEIRETQAKIEEAQDVDEGNTAGMRLRPSTHFRLLELERRAQLGRFWREDNSTPVPVHLPGESADEYQARYAESARRAQAQRDAGEDMARREIEAKARAEALHTSAPQPTVDLLYKCENAIQDALQIVHPDSEVAANLKATLFDIRASRAR